MAKVPDTPENDQRCLCPGCPSYPGQGKLYCARGKSMAPVTQKGCICGDCENFKEYGLDSYYFCVKGTAQ